MNKIFPHIISLFFLIVIFIVPHIASAQFSERLPSLIVCGQLISDPCKVCHLYVLADRIINFLLILILPVAALVIAWGGVKYMLSRGNPGGVGDAQKTIWNGVKGIVIALIAWLIVNTIISVLSNGTLTNWGQFPSCP